MVLRQRLMEQMESRMQVEDEELRDLIDMAILEAAEGAYLPLKERLCLRKELFDSFRRLDILQELVDDPTITEIMVNGTEHIFVERQGRVEELEKHFDSVGQLGSDSADCKPCQPDGESGIPDCGCETGRWFSCPRGAGTGGVKWADFNDPEVPGTDHDGTSD